MDVPTVSRDRLRAYLAGLLPEHEVQLLDRRIELEPEALTVLDELSRDESLEQQLLETFPIAEFATEPTYSQVVEQATQVLITAGSTHGESLGGMEDCGGAEYSGRPADLDSISDLLPSQLGDYSLLEMISSCELGDVYKARHHQGNLVALKLLRPSRTKHVNLLARFVQEMEAIRDLDHPHLVRTIKADSLAGTHFVVTEFLEGRDLNTIVEELGPLSPADACEIIRQAAIGLEHAHQCGLIHRYLKPANLLLVDLQRSGVSEGIYPTAQGAQNITTSVIEPIVKIQGFGLARLFSDQMVSEISVHQQVSETVDYMPPEQAIDPQSVDIRSDIYSLGGTLYKLLTGQAPFETDEFPTMAARFVAHLSKRPVPVAALRAEVPQGLSDIVDKMLAKEKRSRWKSPMELATVLGPYCIGANLSALLRNARGLPEGNSA